MKYIKATIKVWSGIKGCCEDGQIKETESREITQKNTPGFVTIAMRVHVRDESFQQSFRAK